MTLITCTKYFNSFPATGDFCRLLMITFANSLDPDQARRSGGIPECFFEKVNLKKKSQMTKKHAKLPSMQRVKEIIHKQL